MKKKKNFSCELALFLSISFFGLSVALMTKANLGNGTISSLPLVLSYAFPVFTNGGWNFVLQAGLLLVLVITTRSMNFGYLLSFAVAWVFGRFIDLFTFIIMPWPNAMYMRIIYLAASFFIMAACISLSINCRLPIMPFDTFLREVVDRFRFSLRRAKTLMDIIFVVLSLVISVVALGEVRAVGVGTIITVLCMGSVMSFIRQWFLTHFQFEPSFSVSRKLILVTEGKAPNSAED